MRITSRWLLALALAFPACNDATAPDYDDANTPDTPVAAQAVPLYEVNPPIKLPPVQLKPTFWTCAAPAEGRFAAAAVRALELEARALQTQDPFQQAVLLAEVARIRHEAKKALLFALTECYNMYGAPLLWMVQDENGAWVLRQFSVAAYHAYLIEKHMETAG